MRVCGVELKGNDAIICILDMSDGLCDIPDCRVRLLTLSDVTSGPELVDFLFAFTKLMEDYKVDKVVVRERHTKGKFAGSAASFKMEAAMQLAEDLEVEIMSAAEIKESLSHNALTIPFASTGLKVFQELAFTTAFANLVR